MFLISLLRVVAIPPAVVIVIRCIVISPLRVIAAVIAIVIIVVIVIIVISIFMGMMRWITQFAHLVEGPMERRHLIVVLGVEISPVVD